jgi:hypothetical protein
LAGLRRFGAPAPAHPVYRTFAPEGSAGRRIFQILPWKRKNFLFPARFAQRQARQSGRFPDSALSVLRLKKKLWQKNLPSNPIEYIDY